MSRADETRAHVLAVARRLLEDGEPATMGRIAAAAGVTRQLLYLRFAGRADLLLEVARAVDADARTPQLQSRVDGAATGVDALIAAVEVQAVIKPRIEGIVRAMQRVEADDAEVAAALAEREQARHSRLRAVVQRLEDDGALAAGWTVQDATDLAWALTSQRSWRQLVVERGWSTRTWTVHTTNVLLAGLVGGSRPAVASAG